MNWVKNERNGCVPTISNVKARKDENSVGLQWRQDRKGRLFVAVVVVAAIVIIAAVVVV